MYILKKETLANKIYLTKNKYNLQEFKKGLIDHKNELSLIKTQPQFQIIYESYKGIIYKNIIGRKIDRKEFKTIIIKLIKVTKELHLMTYDLPNFWLDILPNWILLISDKNIRNYMKDLYDKLSIIIHSKYNNEPLVTSHHNIHPSNILLQMIILFLLILNMYIKIIYMLILVILSVNIFLMKIIKNIILKN